jgi:hypothetical protein
MMDLELTLWVLLGALESFRVTHMLYVDDLTMKVSNPLQLLRMLRRLELYAAKKGLVVNVHNLYSQFQCVLRFCSFNISIYNLELEERGSFIYLEALFGKHTNFYTMLRPMLLRPLNAAIRRMKEFGIEKRK